MLIRSCARSFAPDWKRWKRSANSRAPPIFRPTKVTETRPHGSPPTELNQAQEAGNSPLALSGASCRDVSPDISGQHALPIGTGAKMLLDLASGIRKAAESIWSNRTGLRRPRIRRLRDGGVS